VGLAPRGTLALERLARQFERVPDVVDLRRVMIDVLVEEHRISALHPFELVVDHRQVVVRRSEPVVLKLVEAAARANFAPALLPSLRERLPLLGERDVVSRAELLNGEQLQVYVVEERFDVRLAIQERIDIVGASRERRARPRRGAREQAVCDGSDQPGDDDRARAERHDLKTLTVSAEFRFGSARWQNCSGN
jgi:hypothetical protein